VIQTVVVTVVPTNAPTEAPTALPAPTQVPATQPPAPTAVVAAPTQGAAPTQASAASGLLNVDNAMGAGWFTNMTVSGNNLALRCQQYKELTFNVTPSDQTISEVQFYYRIEDRVTGAVLDWKNFGRMSPDANGNFSLTFSGENVNADLRKPNAWFDFQFVGLSRSGGVVGRSEKIVQQVNYMFDCP
jgi:hypothetical protein